MLSVMVCTSWQAMGAWHSYTQAHIPVGRLTAWRVCPSAETLAEVPACYRPTRLQLTEPHPAVIDWIPWAPMRDRVIMYHSSSPRLDELISELGNHYVMEVDLSKLVAGFPPTPGYVSVWDLVRVLAPEATSGAAQVPQDSDWGQEPDYLDARVAPVADPMDDEMDLQMLATTRDAATTLPAPNVQALFTSKVLAQRAFEMMGMNKGPHNFRLDPTFFQKYPELYDCDAKLAATGIPLRPREQRNSSVPVPQPLRPRIISQYKELVRWTAASVHQNGFRL